MRSKARIIAPVNKPVNPAIKVLAYTNPVTICIGAGVIAASIVKRLFGNVLCGVVKDVKAVERNL